MKNIKEVIKETLEGNYDYEKDLKTPEGKLGTARNNIEHELGGQRFLFEIWEWVDKNGSKELQKELIQCIKDIAKAEKIKIPKI